MADGAPQSIRYSSSYFDVPRHIGDNKRDH